VARKAFSELSHPTQLLVRKQIVLSAPVASGYFGAVNHEADSTIRASAVKQSRSTMVTAPEAGLDLATRRSHFAFTSDRRAQIFVPQA
jgi:hypothetical protein